MAFSVPGSAVKRTPLKTRRKATGARVRAAQALWSQGIEPCTVCRAEGTICRGMGLDPHHCIPAQKLRALVDSEAYHGRYTEGEKDARMAEVVYDLRNRQWLCRGRHDAHHGNQPIPYSLIPAEAIAYAEELGLGYVLEREYSLDTPRGLL